MSLPPRDSNVQRLQNCTRSPSKMRKPLSQRLALVVHNWSNILSARHICRHVQFWALRGPELLETDINDVLVLLVIPHYYCMVWLCHQIVLLFRLCKKLHSQNQGNRESGFNLRPLASQSYCHICILYFIFYPWPSRIKPKLVFSFNVLNWNPPWRGRSCPQEVAPCIQTEDWGFNNFSFTLTLNPFDGSEGKMEFRLAKEWNIPTLWFIIQPKGVLCDSGFRQKTTTTTLEQLYRSAFITTF